MKFNFGRILFTAALLELMQSCMQPAKPRDFSRLTSDSSIIVVDESIQPIVDEELTVFKALNPKVHPKVTYAPENNVVNQLLEDSTRVIVIGRDLDSNEYKTLLGLNLRPRVTRFAIDGIAIIVNKASNDTSISVSEIKKMLNGQAKQDKNIVFDNPNSGLVRYLKQLSGNKTLQQKNIFSLKSNKEVIKYVSQHADAIGIVDFSWLNDPSKDYASAVDNVKIAGVKDDTGKNPSGEYFTPSQTTLFLKQYPLARNLNIINCAGNISLGMEFDFFARSDQGQRIIAVSGLLPDNIPDRQVQIVKK